MTQQDWDGSLWSTANRATIKLELICTGDPHTKHRGRAIDRQAASADPALDLAARCDTEVGQYLL